MDKKSQSCDFIATSRTSGKLKEAVTKFGAAASEGGWIFYGPVERAKLRQADALDRINGSLNNGVLPDPQARELRSEVWWWGRGVRWPGWAIIGYIGLRSTLRDPEDKSGFTIQEGLIAAAFFGIYFAILFQNANF